MSAYATDPVTFGSPVQVTTNPVLNALYVDTESTDAFVYHLYQENGNNDEIFFTSTTDGEVNAKTSIIVPEAGFSLFARAPSIYPYPDDSVLIEVI